MIELAGERPYPQAKGLLDEKLNDMTFIVGCVPDRARTQTVTADRAELTIRPGLSFVRGELATTIERLPAQAPFASSLLIRTKGIGSSAEVTASFAVEEAGAGSKLKWRASVTQLGGLLKAVPKGLIQAAAQKTIEEMLAAVEGKV
jgi:carbon monoxide dehydrogenase subunit G